MTVTMQRGLWVLIALLVGLCAYHLWNIQGGNYHEFMGLKHLNGEVDSHSHDTYTDANGNVVQEGSAVEGRNNEWSYLVPWSGVRDANVCAYDRNLGNQDPVAGRAYDRNLNSYNIVHDRIVDLYRNCRFPNRAVNREWHQTGTTNNDGSHNWLSRRSDHEPGAIGPDDVNGGEDTITDDNEDFHNHGGVGSMDEDGNIVE